MAVILDNEQAKEFNLLHISCVYCPVQVFALDKVVNSCMHSHHVALIC